MPGAHGRAARSESRSATVTVADERLITGAERVDMGPEHRRCQPVPPMLRRDADRQDLAARARLRRGRHDRAHQHVLHDRRGDAHPIALVRRGEDEPRVHW